MLGSQFLCFLLLLHSVQIESRHGSFAKERSPGLGRWWSGWQSLLFLAPRSDGLEPPVTPAREDPVPFSGPCVHQAHTWHILTQSNMNAHNFLLKEKARASVLLTSASVGLQGQEHPSVHVSCDLIHNVSFSFTLPCGMYLGPCVALLFWALPKCQS